MSKELSVQRELNYASCHTVTVNLMPTDWRINNLSEAADALLSSLPKWNNEVIEHRGHKRPYRRLQTCLSNHTKYCISAIILVKSFAFSPLISSVTVYKGPITTTCEVK